MIMVIQASSVATSALAATRTPTPTRFPPRDTATPSQTASPSPIPPTIADQGYEILFPMMIRYWVVLRLSVSTVKAAQIRIVQPDLIDQTIDLPLKDTLKPLNDVASIIY